MDEYDLMEQQYQDQSDLQREDAEQKTTAFAPQLREQVNEMKAALIEQTDPAKSLQIVLNGFRGKVWNSDEGQFIQVGNPIMNEKGISEVASFLTPILNSSTRFGNISPKFSGDVCLQLIDDITEKIGLNWREYDIKDDPAKHGIIDSLTILTRITISRSEDQGEKNWLARTIIETISGGGTAQKKRRKEENIWGSFKL